MSLIHNADVTLDAAGHAEVDLTGLTDPASATAELNAVEHFDGLDGVGSKSRQARGDTCIAGGTKDGAPFSTLFIDGGEPNAVVHALVWQH